MKKKIIALCLVVVLAITAITGATLAYFTDTDEATNTFTVGNVKIKLIESNLHRSNAGYANGTQPAEGAENAQLWSNVNKEGKTSEAQLPYFAEDTYYTDAQIKADAEKYTCEDVKLNPSESYHKMPYVINTGANDAYIRIRVMIPHDLNGTILDSSMYTAAAVSSGEFTLDKDKTGTVERTVDGTKRTFDVYTFTRVDPLEPEQMTTWNVWGTIHMDADVTNEEIATYFGTGKTYADGTFPVLVEADAIQADGFKNVTEAFAAFDAQ